MKNPSLRFLPPLFRGAVILLFLLAPSLSISCPAASADEIRVDVHPDRPISRPGDLHTGVCLEDVNHEIYGGLYSQLLFGESFQEPPANPAQALGKISGMWRPILRGSAVGSFSLDTQRPFVGSQSQQMTFQSGQGDVAIQNRGLNGWGISILAGKSYEGRAWVRGGCAHPPPRDIAERRRRNNLFAAVASSPRGQLDPAGFFPHPQRHRHRRRLRWCFRGPAPLRLAMPSCSPDPGGDSKACRCERTWRLD